MFGWFTPKSPLTDEQRAWLDMRFDWLIDQFGRARLEGTVITPTDDFFPDRYDGTQAAAAVLFTRVCRYMDIDPARMQLDFHRSGLADEVAVAFSPGVPNTFALGLYDERDKQIRISLEETRLREPLSVVATMAHELGHVHLLSGGRCSTETEDHEPLTDLLTIFFGLGIFTANSVIREVNWHSGRYYGSSASRQGYLSGAQCAYVLALYAWQRGETKPGWSRYLRPDVRAWLKVELKRLQAPGSASGPVEREPNPQHAAAEPYDSSSEAFTNESEESVPADGTVATSARDDAPDEFLTEDVDALPEGIVVPLARGSADELFSRGVAYAQNGQFDEALAAYTEALGKNPDDAEIRIHRAAALTALGRSADAVRDCNLALEQGDDPAALRARGDAYLRLRQFSAAVDDLTRVLRADNRDPEAYLIRGLAQSGLGRYQPAIADFNQAIRNAPTWGVVYLARGRAYEALGKTRQAQGDRLEAIRREPALADEKVQAAWLGESG